MIFGDIRDTICAISTPRGVGGIAVVRVSGKDAFAISDRIWNGSPLSGASSHTAHLGEIIDPNRDGETIDQCVATVFRGPRSYTGEDTVEFSLHGSKWIQREVIRILVENGCRLAEAGEYTRRALINGRIDLAQAEGIADVIASSSRASHRIAMSQVKGSISRRLADLRPSLVEISALLELELDFSEEEVEFADRTKLIALAEDILKELTRLHSTFSNGNAIREGVPVAIAGATNAGKSSLLNALLQDDRAIVSEIHGTTRDTVEDTLEIGDYLFRFIDTAGLRETEDEIERIGIRRSHEAIDRARIVIHVIDVNDQERMADLSPITQADGTDVVTVFNKIDLVDDTKLSRLKMPGAITLSTITGEGVEELKATLTNIMDATQTDGNEIMITNLRQAQALSLAIDSTRRLIASLRSDIPTDLVAQDLRETLTHLSSITGTIPSTEILQTVFSRFCIGK